MNAPPIIFVASVSGPAYEAESKALIEVFDTAVKDGLCEVVYRSDVTLGGYYGCFS